MGVTTQYLSISVRAKTIYKSTANSRLTMVSKTLKSWCLSGGRSLVHMHSWMHYHTHISTQCMQVTIAINAPKLHLCVHSSGTVGIGYVHRRLSITMSMCTIWACARVNTSSASGVPGQGCCTAKFRCACSWDFTSVAVYLVVQMDLSRWKAVCCGQLTIHWSLDHWQGQSRLTNHAIIHEPSLTSKSKMIILNKFFSLCYSYIAMFSV